MTDATVMQALQVFKEKYPDEGTELELDAFTEAFPQDLSRLHICVYELMLAAPGLDALDAIKVLARTGILLQGKGRLKNDQG